MYSNSELLILLHDIESDLVERKRNLADSDKVRQAICAFANDLPNHKRPGVVFIGVENDGSLSGLPITDELLTKLAHMRDDGQILTFPNMIVRKLCVENADIAVVTVMPSDMPPIRYNGRVWIRVGPRRATATEEEERRLLERRRWGNLPFDQQAALPASIDDLNLLLFQQEYLPCAVAPETISQNNRSVIHQLQALHFLTREGYPNYAAILLFGREPRQFLPGAYVQFVRFEGKEIIDPVLSQHEFSGSLSSVLRQIDEILHINIKVRADLGGPREVRQPDYPLVSLQELTRNAVMHRTYESTNAPVRIYWFADRIEIISPGGLYGNVNSQNFGSAGVTDYRNPLIAEAMKVLGFVQKFGFGVKMSRTALERNGNPPPEFNFDPGFVYVLVRARS